MEFEWDPKKATTNLRKHRVSFEEASTIFGDLLAAIYEDPDHSANEKRYLIVGTSTMDDYFTLHSQIEVNELD